MPDCSVLNVLTDAAGLLGDPTQDQFDGPFLTPYYGTAFRSLTRLMQKWGLPRIQREAFITLAANTDILYPSQIASDFGEPTVVWERGVGASVAINAVAPVGGLTTIQVNTSSPHGLTGTPEVFASGVGGVPAANGRWFADVVNPTTINLRGSIFSGSYTSGGTISSSSEKFVPMTEVEAILAGNTLSGTLGTWAWQDQALHFIGATAARQLWIPYLNSGAPPPSGNIGIDDARDFLAYATAAYAAPTQDMATRRAELLVDSFGPTKQADGSGGLLRDLVLPMLNQKNRLQKRSGRFGARSVDPARRIFV